MDLLLGKYQDLQAENKLLNEEVGRLKASIETNVTGSAEAEARLQGLLDKVSLALPSGEKIAVDSHGNAEFRVS